MSRVFPEIMVCKDGQPIGALDIRHTEFHLSIFADRGMTFGAPLDLNTSYQLQINNGGIASYKFVNEYCPRCIVEHPVFKSSEVGTDTLDVRLLRVSAPYDIGHDMFIYNEIKFTCR